MGMGNLSAVLPGWRMAGLTAAFWFAGGAGGQEHKVLHWLISLGLLGVLLVSIVDSSFVPLPIPGVTDIMVILFAAQHANVWLLVLAATAGSALGGLFSYQVGQSGGLAFIEKRTPKRIFKQVTGWMENHAILAVSVPALLPPPMPLSPFVLAAGCVEDVTEEVYVGLHVESAGAPRTGGVGRGVLREDGAGDLEQVHRAVGDAGAGGDLGGDPGECGVRLLAALEDEP